MADLKTGTTIGGALVWTQGNFPLYPTGDTLLYKNFLVYSENNKPQAADNDFVSKANGGTYASQTVYNRGIHIGGSGTAVGVQGISLYGTIPLGGGKPHNGIYMGQTTYHGAHGFVPDGQWAEYFRLGTSGGWIFQQNDINVASINHTGDALFRAVSVGVMPTNNDHLTRKDYVDGLINNVNTNADSRVLRSGDTMTGSLTSPKIYVTSAATDSNQVPWLGQVVQRGTVLDYGEF